MYTCRRLFNSALVACILLITTGGADGYSIAPILIRQGVFKRMYQPLDLEYEATLRTKPEYSVGDQLQVPSSLLQSEAENDQDLPNFADKRSAGILGGTSRATSTHGGNRPWGMLGNSLGQYRVWMPSNKRGQDQRSFEELDEDDEGNYLTQQRKRNGNGRLGGPITIG